MLNGKLNGYHSWGQAKTYRLDTLNQGEVYYLIACLDLIASREE